jgi:hypothetical protein
MELLLNLSWLTLALPAIWMWRHESVCDKDCWRLDRIRIFLLLGCALVLLFPVVSATDDLHAMRQVMEESSPAKRVVKQAVGVKVLAGLSNSGVLPALISPLSSGPSDEVCGRVLVASIVLPQSARSDESASRAPPFSSLKETVGFAA